jgi:hypothetical protein
MAKRNLWMVMLVCVLALGMMACPIDADPDLAGELTITSSDGNNKGATLTANYTGTEVVTYQWDLDGFDLTGKTSTTCKADEAGVYTVTISADGFQSKSASWTIDDDKDPGITDKPYQAFLGTWKMASGVETIELTPTKFRLDYKSGTDVQYFEIVMSETTGWTETEVPSWATAKVSAITACYIIKGTTTDGVGNASYLDPDGAAKVALYNEKGLYLFLTNTGTTLYRSAPSGSELSPNAASNPTTYQKQP